MIKDIISTRGLSGPIKSTLPMNERVHKLVGKKVIILNYPRDTGWQCCVLDMVWYRNLEIFSYVREGFTADDVHHLGTFTPLRSIRGASIPVIYLKADRPQTTLSDKEFQEIVSRWR